MLPQTGNFPIGKSIVVKRFVFFVQRNDRIIAIGLFHPLHTIKRIIEYLLASFHKCLILASFEIGKSGVLFIKTVIVVDEVNGSVSTIFLYFAHHTTNAITIIGIVFFIHRYTVVTHGDELTRFGNIKPYTLMHNSNQVLCHILTTGFGVSVGHLVLRKYDLRIGPMIAIL
ncbi:hypothetical protein SDC9_148074 [bioreactor metagenome]|uniref:Uncharacterized protein n=1 Tax=bioreactor metagenome TaxID=1076179 RepID=A0A645EHE9_9ZZZZ